MKTKWLSERNLKSFEKTLYTEYIYENPTPKKRGSIYLTINGVFKQIHIFYFGEIALDKSFEIDEDIGIIANYRKRFIIIRNINRKKTLNNVSLKFKGYINGVSRVYTYSYGGGRVISDQYIENPPMELDDRIMDTDDSIIVEHSQYDKSNRIEYNDDQSNLVPSRGNNFLREKKFSNARSRLPKTYYEVGKKAKERCSNCAFVKWEYYCNHWDSPVRGTYFCNKWKKVK